VGAELFHEGGRAEMMKLTVAFLNCANAPTNATLITEQVAEVCESCGAKYKWRRLSIIPDPTKQAMYWAVETLHTKHFKQNAKSLFSYCRDVENTWPISITSVWTKSSRCVLILYIHFIIYISVNTTVQWKHRLKRHVST